MRLSLSACNGKGRIQSATDCRSIHLQEHKPGRQVRSSEKFRHLRCRASSSPSLETWLCNSPNSYKEASRKTNRTTLTVPMIVQAMGVLVFLERESTGRATGRGARRRQAMMPCTIPRAISGKSRTPSMLLYCTKDSNQQGLYCHY